MLKGKNGSGKSTVATMLSQKLTEKGISTKVLAFADPLKKIADKITNKEENWENREFKNENRDSLELVANAIKTSFNFNPFVQEILNQLDILLSYDGTVAIISDLRFESEYNGLYNYVESDRQLIVVEIKNPLTHNTPSEYDLDLIPTDKIINFDVTVEEQIDNLIEKLI